MSELNPFSSRELLADTKLDLQGGVYHGGVLKSSAVGVATVDIYDGGDTGADLVDAFVCALSHRDVHVLERGVLIRNALYIDVGSNVTSFTLFYEPPPAVRA